MRKRLIPTCWRSASSQWRAELFKKLKPLGIADCPFANLPEKKADAGCRADGREDGGVPVAETVLVAQFEFVEWTSDGHVRHSKYVGMREDKKAGEVQRERPE